jgi:hypothetical protein
MSEQVTAGDHASLQSSCADTERYRHFIASISAEDTETG